MSLSEEIGDGVPLGIKLKGAAGDVIAMEVHAARERANRDASAGRLRTYGCIVCGLGFWQFSDLNKGRRPEHSRIGLNTCGSETNCIERVSGLNPNIGRPSGKEMPPTNVFTGDSVDTYEQVFAR
jgi:hypothetical protein